MLPDRIRINGRWYVAEGKGGDGGATDPWLPMRRLCDEYRVDPHKAYESARAGDLDARMPNGYKRGLRVRRSEFERWVYEGLMRAPVS